MLDIQVGQVFTETSWAKANYLKRDYLHKQLDSILQTHNQSFFIVGPPSSGKTSFINFAKDEGILSKVLYVSCSVGSKYSDIMKHLGIELEIMITQSKTLSEGAEAKVSVSPLGPSAEAAIKTFRESVEVPDNLSGVDLYVISKILNEYNQILILDEFQYLLTPAILA